jgi:hypothetical protein
MSLGCAIVNGVKKDALIAGGEEANAIPRRLLVGRTFLENVPWGAVRIYDLRRG